MRRVIAAFGLLVVLTGSASISCSGGGGSATGGTGGGSTGGTGGSGTSPRTSKVSVRLVNTFLPVGTTGPSLDIYDYLVGTAGSPSAVGTLLVAGLAYGAVSDYVTPHFSADGSTSIYLAALPAGTPPPGSSDAVVVWQGLDDGSHEQVTVLLENLGGTDTGPLNGLGFSSFVEKGDDGQGTSGPLAPPAPVGQGELLASSATIDVAPTPLPPAAYYFFVDDSCTPPLNGDPNVTDLPDLFAADGVAPKSFFALFPAAGGTHQISVVTWTDPLVPTCQQLTARQGTTTTDIAAGQQILAFVYGSSLTDLHLVTAPIAP